MLCGIEKMMYIRCYNNYPMSNSTRLQRSPACNQKVLDHTVAQTGETPQFVKSIVGFYWSFIQQKIEAGALESVRIPLFGVFRPKLNEVKHWGQGVPADRSVRVAGGLTKHYKGRRSLPDETV